MRKASLSTIPVYYDYQRMSPSSSTNVRNESKYDGAGYSLFGDPVPPPPDDFLDNLDNHLYGNIRHGCYTTDLDELSKTQTYLDTKDECPKPALRSLHSNILPTVHDLNSTYTVNERLRSPRLPPDIQILPDSGESSSEHRQSPNYPFKIQQSATIEDDSFCSMERYLNTNTSEDMTRRYSGFSEDVNMNISPPRQSLENEMHPRPSSRRLQQQNSNDSYSSQEWFKPSRDYQEFTKIPRLRPSSRSILSISRSKIPIESPVATLINDSNGSSSSEERLLNYKCQNHDEYQQVDPIVKSPQTSETIENESSSPKLRRSNEEMQRGSVSTAKNHQKSSPESTPERPELPLTSLIKPPGTSVELNKEVTPVILTDCITTGADHRLDHQRSHKKSSFTIIAEKSPQSSRVPSPLAFPPTDRLSPFLGHGFKEPAKPVAMPRQLQKKSLSASHLTLPTIVSSSNNLNTSDDSPRPSVQFDISSRHVRSSPVKVPPVPKSIIQSKLQENTAKSLPLASQMSQIKSYENLPLLTDHIKNKSRRNFFNLTKSNGDISTDSQFEKVTRPVFRNFNPTRKQRGLLEIVNTEESKSKIHYSNWASLDDLSIKPRPLLAPISKSRRRSSSTSPERRSSTQTEPRSSIQSDRRSSRLSSITTSDFSFRRNSVAQPNSKTGGTTGIRRKSIFQSTPKKPVGRSVSYLNISRTPRKIVKPTTLSPIIGTPNKDSQLSSEDANTSQPRLRRSSSVSKIPVRGNSRGTSRSNSRIGSRSNSRGPSLANSRTSSPQKELHSRPTSRVENNLSPSRTNTRSESRATSRAGSRAELRTNESRNTSRAESHAPSTFASKNSYRANSRLGLQSEKSTHNTESNRSRSSVKLNKSQKSNPSRGSNSPPKAANQINSKRRSPSPKGKRQKSKSPPKRSRSQGRRSSRSRIPARIVTKQKSKSVSPPKIQQRSPDRSSSRKLESSAKNGQSQIRKSESSGKLASSTVNKDVAFKRETTNLKRSSMNLKREQSSLQKSNLKRDPSRLSLKKSVAGTVASGEIAKKIPNTKAGNMKREPSNMALKSNGSTKNLLKSKTDSTVSNKLEKKNSFKNEKKPPTADAGGGSSGRLSSEGKSTPASLHGNSSLGTPSTTRKAAGQNEPTGGGHSTAKTKQSSRSSTPTSPAGQMMASEDLKSLPNAILEKSQKTLETIQKTVTEATDEIHKTINENLTDLKSMESGMGQSGDGIGTPVQFEKSENLKTILETTSDSEKSTELMSTIKSTDNQLANKTPLHSNQPIEASVSVINSQSMNKNLNVPANQSTGSSSNSGSPPKKSDGGLVNNIASNNGSSSKNDQMANEDMAERVSERAISVLPEVECESANLQNFDVTTATAGVDALPDNDETNVGPKVTTQTGTHSEQPATMDGGQHADNNNGSGSQEFLGETEKESPRGCCSCCSRICLPCRRLRMCRWCKKSKKSDSETAAVIVDEIDEKPKSQSCWKRMKCCKRKSKTSDSVEEILGSQKMDIIAEENERSSSNDDKPPPKRNKCGLCLRKFFCCRPANKVETSTVDVEKPRMCCFCIPCRKKKSQTQPDVTAESQIAWQNTESMQNIENTENIINEAEAVQPVQGSRCSRFMNKLKCWKKKQPATSDSRRQSVKQGTAPTLADDARSKLHVDLVEFNSKMKGAIPVMPLYLAWLCMICNTLVPGLGTVLSGFFCLCVGIPRFSQYDSAKARFGSFFINCIVGVAQLFCVLFCFVGWGWSIWWGTIMLKTARKLKKIKRVEVLEMEEDRRQAAAAAIATTATKTAEKDVEAAKPTST